MTRHKNKFRLRLTSFVFIVTLLGYGGLIVINAPDLSLQPSVKSQATQTSQAVALKWPDYGQAAVGASGFGVLEIHGDQTPVPTASTAKIMTALAVLKAKPLSASQTAVPLITLTQADVDIYNSFIVKDGSVTLVQAGEQISEYQALQALLLPSANNMADSLATWAFGSLDAYTTYASQLASQLGLSGTHIADASGFSPSTTSTAQDLVKLSLVAMKDPVFADIVSQPSAVIPVAGKIYNINGLLGRDNIIGIKTGNTDQAGGVFVVATTHNVGGQTVTVVTAVMGAPNLDRSMLDSVPLLASAKQNFVPKTIMSKGTTVGSYDVPWAGRVSLKTSRDLNLVVWGGSSVLTTNNVETLRTPENAGTPVGIVVATSHGVSARAPINTSSAIARPSLWWRMKHPF
jgi:D-alanyl-D-alanine carboxypeptidase (penicillin-binding protein 5/6)